MRSRKWWASGEGVEDSREIVKALGEIGYDGWAAAQVSGGVEKELEDIADSINKVLELS